MTQNKRLLIMVPLLLIAAWLAFFGDKGHKTEVAEPIVRSAQNGVSNQATGVIATSGANQPASAPAATLRDSVSKALNDNSPVNLFSTGAPPPPPPSAKQADAEPAPPAPNFTYIGSRVDDGRLTVFLEKDNQTYLAVPGADIGEFHVEAVQSHQITLSHAPTKSTHIIPIESDK